jgi:riboflavin kinase/FMN adenylyltransferase
MPNACTIGTFDGVHVGHAALVARCRDFARATNARAIALAFDPHPMTQLSPANAPARLITWERKRSLLLAAGADEVVRLEPTPDLLSKTGDEFLVWVFERCNPALLVEGADFHYGKGRDGNVRTLAAFAGSRGARVEVIPGVEVALGDHQIARASSSLVRWLITQGRVSDARTVLGRPYALEGTVVPGDRKGRTIGVPTCNLATECLLPLDGVYTGLATLPTGESLPAAIAVGARPTVAGTQRRAEVHILRPTLPTNDVEIATSTQPLAWAPLAGVPEYHWPLRVELHAFVRDEVKFPTWEHLRAQITRDIHRVRTLTGRLAPEAIAPG